MANGPAAEGGTPKKESSVLTEGSIAALAKEFSEQSLVLAMYLNIPTTTLVNFHLAVHEQQKTEEEVLKEILIYWKNMRATAKEREKVADLERAMRELGKPDHADLVMDKHKENAELTPDCFPSV